MPVSSALFSPPTNTVSRSPFTAPPPATGDDALPPFSHPLAALGPQAYVAARGALRPVTGKFLRVFDGVVRTCGAGPF